MNHQIVTPPTMKTALQIAVIAWTVLMGAITLIMLAVDSDPVFTALNGVLFILGVSVIIAINWRFKIERIPAFVDDEITYSATLNIPKPSTATYGYVYIIQDVSHTKQYKIGRAIHPDERINHFTVKLPIQTKVIHLIPCENYIKAESMLHDVFADVRGYGEWFTLNDSQIKLLKSIKRL